VHADGKRGAIAGKQDFHAVADDHAEGANVPPLAEGPRTRSFAMTKIMSRREADQSDA